MIVDTDEHGLFEGRLVGEREVGEGGGGVGSGGVGSGEGGGSEVGRVDGGEGVLRESGGRRGDLLGLRVLGGRPFLWGALCIWILDEWVLGVGVGV